MKREYKDNRAKELAIIHAQAKKLNMNDDTYRDYLESLTGKRSAKELQGRERAKVIADMEKLSRPAKSKSTGYKRRVKPAPDRQPLLNKVYALLYHLDLSIDYALGILKQMFADQAPARLEWANQEQLYKLVQSLEIHKRRQEKVGKTDAN